FEEESGEATVTETSPENMVRYDRRPQRSFTPRHQRVERSHAASQEKQPRTERNDKRTMRNEQQPRERRGGHPFRPQRDKVPTSGTGDFPKSPQEKRD
ncbi:hypothetical protein MXD63_39255, partial [Frankia sp. Cpl3]|nr:hypothetical protein [Frankia sp. Cpl3]